MLKDSSNISKEDKLAARSSNPLFKQNTTWNPFQKPTFKSQWPSKKFTPQRSNPKEQKMIFANSALEELEDFANEGIQQQQNNKNFPSNTTQRDLLNSSSLTSNGKPSRKVLFDKLESPFQSSGKALRILQINKSSVQRNLFANYEKESDKNDSKTRSDRKTQASADKSRWSLFNTNTRQNLSDRFIPFHSSGSSKISSIQCIFQTDASNKQRKQQAAMDGRQDNQSSSSSSDQANNSVQSSSSSDSEEIRPPAQRRSNDRNNNNPFRNRQSNEMRNSNSRTSQTGNNSSTSHQ